MADKVEAVVRLARTMPREGFPGVGLHCLYYANNSSRRSLIITKGIDSPLLPVREDVIVHEVFYDDLAATRDRLSAFEMVNIGLTKLRGEFTMLFSALGQIRKHRIKTTIIHVHSANYLLAGVLLKMITGAPLCLNFGGTELVRAKRLIYYRLLFRFLDTGFYVSRSMEGALYSYLPEERCVYTANGLDDKTFYSLKNAEKRNEITAVGNLRWQKDYPNLLRAFSIVHRAKPEYRLRIFGDGSLRAELQQLSESLGLAEAVTFEGMRSPDEIRAAHNRAKLFVLSSKSEGFPKAQIEAMACGLPVVVTDTGSCREVAGDAGRVAPVGDHEKLAAEILHLLDNPAALKACARAAVSNSTLYSWRNVCKVVDSRYDILEKR